MSNLTEHGINQIMDGGQSAIRSIGGNAEWRIVVDDLRIGSVDLWVELWHNGEAIAAFRYDNAAVGDILSTPSINQLADSLTVS